MSETRFTRVPRDSQYPIPVVMFDAEAADAAFSEHAELVRIEAAIPLLSDCAAFRTKRLRAYQRFLSAFVVGGEQ